MILVDTSVWIGHLRHVDARLVQLLERTDVLGHPAVVGEIGLGSLRQRAVVIESMRALPQAVVASDEEVLHFVEQHSLHGHGIGWVDAHLLAATRLTPGARLWTGDKRLASLAHTLGMGDLEGRH